MSVAEFIREREYGGHHKSSKYRQYRHELNNWLDRLAAAPAVNQPCDFSGEPKATFLVDFSPDGTKIASSHGDHTVRVTEVATGKCTHILTGHPRTPWCLAFHPSHNDILASGCLGGQVRIWDLRGGGSEVFTSDGSSLIASLTFHPLDKLLVFSTKNKVYFWDWTLSKPSVSCASKREYQAVRWVKFDAYGHYLFTGVCNGTEMPGHFLSSRNRDELRNQIRWRGPFRSHAFMPSRSDGSSRRINLANESSVDNSTRDRVLDLRSERRNARNYMRLLGVGWDAIVNQNDNSDGEDEDRPPSPVHEDRLRQAFDYARYVTSHSRDSNRGMDLSARRPRPTSGAGSGQLSARDLDPYGTMLGDDNRRPRMGANSPPPQPLRSLDSDSDEDDWLMPTPNLASNRAPTGNRPVLESLPRPGSQSSSSASGRPPADRPDVQPARMRRDHEIPRNQPSSWTGQSIGQSSAQATSTRNTGFSSLRQGMRQSAVDDDWGIDLTMSSLNSVGASSASVPVPLTLSSRDSEHRTRNPPSCASTTSQLRGTTTNSGRIVPPNPALSGLFLPAGGRNSPLDLRNSSSVSSQPSPPYSLVSTRSSFNPASQSEPRLAFHDYCRREFSGGSEARGSSSSSDQNSHTAPTRGPVSDFGVPFPACLRSASGEASAASDSVRGTGDSNSTVSSAGQRGGTTSVPSVSAPTETGSSAANSTVTSSSTTGIKRPYSSAFSSDSLPSTSQSVPEDLSSSRDATAGPSSASERDPSTRSRIMRRATNIHALIRPMLPRSFHSNIYRPSGGASSFSNRSEDTGDQGELETYQPGNLSCSYLYRFFRNRRYRHRSIHRTITADVNHVRQLVRQSNYVCDFYFAPSGFLECPVCQSSPDMPNRPHPRYLREERLRPSVFRFDRDPLLGDPQLYWSDHSERTSDGTSQTTGDLNAPEHTDQGTDMFDFRNVEVDTLEDEIFGELGPSSHEERDLERRERDLERRLLENDDEMSRIEARYLEEMRQLTERRNQILSTVRDQSSGSVTAQAPGSSNSVPQESSSVTSASSSATAASTSAPSGLATSSGTAAEPGTGPQEESSGSSTSMPSQEMGPFHTLPSPAGSSSQTIEVISGTGVHESITYSELAQRMANREDVLVIGNHRQVSTEPQSGSASGELQQSDILRSCLARPVGENYPPRPVPPPSSQPPSVSSSSSSSSTSFSSSTATSQQSSRFPPPPRILVQRPSSDDQPQGTSQESASPPDPAPSLPEYHLHPHYARSVMDNPLFGRTLAFQSSINNAIAGVFMSSGEQAVASNIVSSTYRIQRWDMRSNKVPDLKQESANIVVKNCKIHNDASIDLSSNSSLLAAFVHIHGGFPDENILGVFSLRKETFGQCLYTKSFGPNAISVSLSPSNKYLMVGLASKRMLFFQVTDQQLVGQVFHMVKEKGGENSMKHITDVYHPVQQRSGPLLRGMSPVSVNSACWLPQIGDGIVYGTNHGDLHFYRAGRTKASVEKEEAEPRKFSISTQTGRGIIRRYASTQTTPEEQSG